MSTTTNTPPLTIDEVHELHELYQQELISFSKFVEMLNEKVIDWHTNQQKDSDNKFTESLKQMNDKL